ncbi:hypothetical protein SKAU_G00006710 [Synaphobranchus kaupii]|uniref:Uncharacterized protein n=1 Tax=Synaphobranchus kaupii TaxID=118154 RepID=A0A9Q1GAC9_SYNKA|nr:hypothetical protein SKAU_G00006710 [Synaphobranchus kaupii]
MSDSLGTTPFCSGGTAHPIAHVLIRPDSGLAKQRRTRLYQTAPMHTAFSDFSVDTQEVTSQPISTEILKVHSNRHDRHGNEDVQGKTKPAQAGASPRTAGLGLWVELRRLGVQPPWALGPGDCARLEIKVSMKIVRVQKANHRPELYTQTSEKKGGVTRNSPIEEMNSLRKTQTER